MSSNLSFLLKFLLVVTLLSSCQTPSGNPKYNPQKAGDVLDEFNGVKVYYNESFSNVSGRNQTEDGYNLGLKYQCVEFVKRYYYEHYKHKMPNPWGHAKSFHNHQLSDGQFNSDRGLIQFSNGGKNKPQIGDLIVFGGHAFNRFGHVAIISKVFDDKIEVVQQNCGTNSRESIYMENNKGTFKIRGNVLGWLRLK